MAINNSTIEETSQVLYTVIEKFKDYIHKYIWVNRYNEVKRWEVENGIKNRKKKKISLPMIINPVTSINLNMLRVAVAIKR
ncbi:hypothetical protein Glove_296g45 [Diversispora epigaea]|uniref:Uncharacterized protein n=1 Tax=Diversispora epigaea TaxID=1348612 RepID=A0A397HZL6_9GLOM|nr:hypothetical protein Glove_296g45 [Diversispora epigaea]